MFEVHLIESLPSRRVGHAKYCSTRDARHRSNTSPPLSEDSSVASQNRPFTDIMRESFVGVQRKLGKTYKDQRETKNANHTCPFDNAFRHIMSSIVEALAFIRSPFTVTINYLGSFSGTAISSNNSAEQRARVDESRRADRPGESSSATNLASQMSWRARGKRPATTDGAFTLEEQIWGLSSTDEPSIVEAAKTWLIGNARGAVSEEEMTSRFHALVDTFFKIVPEDSTTGYSGSGRNGVGVASSSGTYVKPRVKKKDEGSDTMEVVD